MDPSPVQYLDRDDVALAYQVVGSGPVDVVWYMEVINHLGLMWADPHIHQLFERSTSYSRSAFLAPRGFGMSAPIPYVATLEQQADDVLAVMDASGMDRAFMFGIWTSAPALVLLAARNPDRVSGLLLANPIVQRIETDRELRGWTTDEVAAFTAAFSSAIENWGTGEQLPLWDSALDTAFNRRLFGLLERCSASPATMRRYFDWAIRVDVTDLLPSIQVPTLVLRVPTNSAPESAIRYVADTIPGATYEVLPVAQPGSSVSEELMLLSDRVQEMATGAPRPADADRRLGTVCFTDVVGSTELLVRLGDSAYRELRASHERQVRLEVDRYCGSLVNVAGDGTFSLFDGPTKALRCAQAIRAAAAELNIQVRCGVHIGEIDWSASEVTGLAVHIGARIGSAAGPGQVLVSRTVRDLLVGSTLKFTSCGVHHLRGVPDRWELFAVDAQPAGGPTSLPDVSQTTFIDRIAMRTARRTPALGRAAMRVGNRIQRRRAKAALSRIG